MDFLVFAHPAWSLSAYTRRWLHSRSLKYPTSLAAPRRYRARRFTSAQKSSVGVDMPRQIRLATNAISARSVVRYFSRTPSWRYLLARSLLSSFVTGCWLEPHGPLPLVVFFTPGLSTELAIPSPTSLTMISACLWSASCSMPEAVRQTILFQILSSCVSPLPGPKTPALLSRTAWIGLWRTT